MLSRALLVLPAVLVACTGGGGDDPTDDRTGKIGLDEYPYCEATETEVSLDELTALGFAAQDVVALADGEHQVTLTWADDTTTPMTLTATLDGRALFVDEEAVYPEEGGPDIGVVCDDHVAIEGTLELVTEDGQLAELVDVTFRSNDGLRADVWAELDPEDLGGTLVFDDFHEETDYDDRGMNVNASFDASGTSGEVGGTVSGTGDCADGEPCTAWQGFVSIGAWGQEEE